MEKLTSSVCIASYNGSMYIQDQLNSIVHQSLPPDEIVVVDDASTDNTVAIVNEFALGSPVPIRVFTSRLNSGHEKNFSNALSKASGDIIFMCDQDDVWYSHKLEVVLEYFIANPQVLLVVNDLDLADMECNALGMTQLEILLKTGMIGKNSSGLITGCATAFRKELLEIVLPIPSIAYGHDTWIHHVARVLDSRVVLPESLQLYRRHYNNASDHITDTLAVPSLLGNLKISSEADRRASYTKRIQAIQEILSRLFNLSGFPSICSFADEEKIADSILSASREAQALFSRTLVVRMPLPWRAFAAISMMFSGQYMFFNGILSMLKDIADSSSAQLDE